VILLTVRPFSSLRIESARCLNTIVFLDFGNIATNDLMLLRKTSRHSKLMKSCLSPQVLLPDPPALNEITPAFLDVSASRMVKMGLSPQDLSVDVAAGMRNDAGSQKEGGQSLREVDHGDRL
jgi:hypothetical protein